MPFEHAGSELRDRAEGLPTPTRPCASRRRRAPRTASTGHELGWSAHRVPADLGVARTRSSSPACAPICGRGDRRRRIGDRSTDRGIARTAAGDGTASGRLVLVCSLVTLGALSSAVVDACLISARRHERCPVELAEGGSGLPSSSASVGATSAAVTLACRAARGRWPRTSRRRAPRATGRSCAASAGRGVLDLVVRDRRTSSAQ